MLIALKGLPLGYSKELQEDKKLIFNSYDTIQLAIKVMTELVKNIKFNTFEMKLAVDQSNATATDLANWLVQNLDYTFRDAYKLTGKIVAFTNKKNKKLKNLTISEIQKFDQRITKSALKVLSSANSINNKKSFGGTSPQSVNKSIEYAIKKYL